ncbi:hypothetical protein WA026_022814 [Henosepilachna vigintioctopunctata]|uniref:DnaJ homolog subfamily C member 2 n=1 Tax=Henosepilachna vigintioctopunctata TaxID=420089 RepID=A0AAW1VC25_9CUCU
MKLNELEELNNAIRQKGKTAFLEAVAKVNELKEKERQTVLETSRPKSEVQNSSTIQIMPEWNEDNIQLLVKAVNIFPAGTSQRWDVVANFINQHGKFKDKKNLFTAKTVLSKAKDLQNTDFSKNNLKDVANKQAFDNFRKDKKSVLNVNENGISKKLDEMSMNDKKPKGDEQKNKSESPWTTAEQQLLEQALKTYPTNTPERWDRVAECIPNRNKKECIKRYKELVETIKAKKAAQAAVNSTK